jgi:hypothetical protein
LPWIANGLIQKLIEARAVELHDDGIAFAKPFRDFVTKRRGIIFRTRTLEQWRLDLGDYNCTLLNLTASEAGATMILLEYSRNNKKIAISDGR